MKIIPYMEVRRHQSTLPRGFALVVTLTLMVLLLILALGLLSLSSVALRTANVGSARQIAQTNARFALMLAIGELQAQAGPDTRITARADILDEKNPPVLGVWKSWEGTDHDATGRPVSPGDYKSVKETPATDPDKPGHFLAWLVSGDRTTIPDTKSGDGKATLVGTGSVGTGAEGVDNTKAQIHLPTIPVNKPGKNGAYAWWVGGENLKARLPEPYQPSSEKSGQWAVQMKSHSTANPEPFGLDILLTEPELGEKTITRDQIDLIKTSTPAVSDEFFYDLSVSSVGLLTNAATGGWKKDFSLFTEKAGTSDLKDLPQDLPLFRLKPDEDSFTTLASTKSIRGSKSIFYPWSEYRENEGSIPIYQHGAVASWNNLIDYALIYKKAAGGKSVGVEATAYDSSNKYNFLHKVRILPLIARIQWIYSHSAAPVPDPAGTGNAMYEPRLLLSPVVTMWNPYNLEITSNPLLFDLINPIPTALKYKVGSYEGLKYHSIFGNSTKYTAKPLAPGTIDFRIKSSFTLKPGETRVFSATSSTPIANGVLELSAGYRSKGGHYFPLQIDDGTINADGTPIPIVAPGSATITQEVKFDTEYFDRIKGVGIHFNMEDLPRGKVLAYRMSYPPAVAAAVYPPLSDLAVSSPLSGLVNSPEKFLTTVFGARMASRTHIPAKGFVQSSPLVNYTTMGGKDVADIGRHYRGSGHPVNSPFDYSFKAITANDSNAPAENDATQRGYIVTGFTSAEGLTRCVVAELPTRPIQSIGELQNWDLRYENPVPPYAFNLIGNSDATPLIKANEVIADFTDPQNLQHDDSYCANHLLFDDWFCSSIAPDPSDFGTSGRDLKTVFKDHINGSFRLPNHAYLPILADAGGDADDLFTKYVDTDESWKNIASRLEVQGMFNVNSTSVTAWRAILGHARDRKIPYITENGISLSGETDHAVSRFSVSGDTDTSSAGISGGFPGATEFTGYRIFDEKMIDALAEEVVKQVRLRGPFLSLSEFVNRQLSSGNLALSGALQSALDEIAKDDSTNPYKGITSTLSRPADPAPPGGPAEYAFPEAAEGESTYGLPGWTRQADILRPLAPILSVRDDTFTIRAYGDARDNDNNILATAVCEATVQRTREYIDQTDAADLATYPTSTQNRTFGRRFQVISFRWLAPGEI